MVKNISIKPLEGIKVSIKVQNTKSNVIEVCINKWGDDGDTSYFSINPNSTETWSRSSDKPFIMIVKQGNKFLTYCVSSKRDIVVSDGDVVKDLNINALLSPILFPNSLKFTPESLQLYKDQFPLDEELQKFTYEELVLLNNGDTVDWNFLKQQNLENQSLMNTHDLTVSECQLAVGYVIMDVICIAIGGVGLRSSFNSATAQAVVKAAGPAITPIGRIINEIAKDSATAFQRAKGILSILSTLYSASCLGAVVKAFLNSLKWYQMVIYGATAMATIVAAVATDGVAFIAEVVLVLGSCTWFALDLAKCIKICSTSDGFCQSA